MTTTEPSLQTMDKQDRMIVDQHVGKRLRARRKVLKLSQIETAKVLGVTFQQLQKYEKATNRLSAGALYAFSKALEVPVTYFFEGLDSPGGPATPTFAEQDKIVQKVASIRDDGTRKAVLELISLLMKCPPGEQKKALAILRIIMRGT